jgi:hypothetical protein
MQEDSKIKLYLEECGFCCDKYQNKFVKNNIRFDLDSVFYKNHIMFRTEHIHNAKLVFGGDVVLNYDRINLIYDFLEHQYQESLKFRKERTKEDWKLDVNLDASKDKICVARIAFFRSRCLTSFLSLDLERLDYKVIYKWHNRYADGVDFNYAIHDEWNSINQ